MIEIIKSWKFWAVWFSIALIGAIIALVMSHHESQKYMSSTPCKLKLYGNKEEVIILPDYYNKDKYLSVLKKSKFPDTWDFNVGYHEPGSIIKVIDTVYNGQLIEYISRERKYPLSNDTTSKVISHWVYKEYVDCSCNDSSEVKKGH